MCVLKYDLKRHGLEVFQIRGFTDRLFCSVYLFVYFYFQIETFEKNKILAFSLWLTNLHLVVCPAFSYGFNNSFLESINLTADSYKDGQWHGSMVSSNTDEYTRSVFRNVTFDIEDGKFLQFNKAV